MGRRIKWTLEKCLKSAQRYSTRKEWRENDCSAIRAAQTHGWYKYCTKHMKKLSLKGVRRVPKGESMPHAKWTLEACQEEAMKHNHRRDWFLNHRTSYNIAQRKGWLDECMPIFGNKSKYHQGPKRVWDLEKCKEEALKYSSREEWEKANPDMYYAVKKIGWLKKCTGHMPKKKMPYRPRRSRDENGNLVFKHR